MGKTEVSPSMSSGNTLSLQCLRVKPANASSITSTASRRLKLPTPPPSWAIGMPTTTSITCLTNQTTDPVSPCKSTTCGAGAARDAQLLDIQQLTKLQSQYSLI